MISKRTTEPAWLTSLREKVGTEIGVTDWFSLSQTEVDQFSDLTDDWDYMHNDPAWAADTSWGGTIVHGLFTLALIPSIKKRLTDLPIISNDARQGLSINYGFDRVRFVSPLRVGQEARGRMELVALEDRPSRDVLIKQRMTVEARGCDRPVLVADVLTLVRFGD